MATQVSKRKRGVIAPRNPVAHHVRTFNHAEFHRVKTRYSRKRNHQAEKEQT